MTSLDNTFQFDIIRSNRVIFNFKANWVLIGGSQNKIHLKLAFPGQVIQFAIGFQLIENCVFEKSAFSWMTQNARNSIVTKIELFA